MATFDLSMSRAQPDGLPALQILVGPNDKGEVVTGGAKLAQKYVIILMTQKGSIPYALTRGSNFVNILRMNGMYTEGDVLSAFAGAQLDMQAQLKPKTTDPLDEQFVKAVVQGIVITSEGVLIKFNIITAATSTISVSLPLTFVLK